MVVQVGLVAQEDQVGLVVQVDLAGPTVMPMEIYILTPVEVVATLALEDIVGQVVHMVRMAMVVQMASLLIVEVSFG